MAYDLIKDNVFKFQWLNTKIMYSHHMEKWFFWSRNKNKRKMMIINAKKFNIGL